MGRLLIPVFDRMLTVFLFYFRRDDIPFDGLLGLAKKDVSQQRVPPLLSALYNASLVSAPIAAYKLPRSKDGHPNQQGELTLGALNPALYDAHTLVEVDNVNPFGYFGVAIGGVSVGGKELGWSNRTGLVDSGTVLVLAPQMVCIYLSFDLSMLDRLTRVLFHLRMSILSMPTFQARLNLLQTLHQANRGRGLFHVI